MSTTPGTRLGVYEVTALLGEGGMGQVYRATDTTLKRQVAIKVLPPSVAGDTERLARFQREAEVLAALNHPHIAAIFGLEKTPEFTALVMELVEGDDLVAPSVPSERVVQWSCDSLPAGRRVQERAIMSASQWRLKRISLRRRRFRTRASA